MMANSDLTLVMEYYVECVLGLSFDIDRCCAHYDGEAFYIGTWETGAYGDKPSMATVMLHESQALVWGAQADAKRQLREKCKHMAALKQEPVIFAAEIAACEAECAQIKADAGL